MPAHYGLTARPECDGGGKERTFWIEIGPAKHGTQCHSIGRGTLDGELVKECRCDVCECRRCLDLTTE